MKIIIVNYRYFISGGPERYLFNVKDLLEKNGHTVIPFSIKNLHNTPSEYEDYFMESIGEGDEVYFKEFDRSDVKAMVKSFARMFYSFDAKKKLDLLIKKVQPDLVYVLHYQNKISASIFDVAAAHGVPVVHRISDFGQICANALFFRPKENDICERCMHGSKWNAVKNKCVHDSYIYSALKCGSMILAEKVVNVKSKIDAFVIPSAFTLKKMVEYGFDSKKLFNIPTFFNHNAVSGENEISYQPFALYIGRIEQEKGLFTLIKAFVNTNYHLKIIGFSSSGYQQELEQFLQGKQHNIEFLGKKVFDEIIPYLQSCAFTIVPSECYDNFPNTILESYAYKKAVVATNLGSLKEMVNEAETGLLFDMQDSDDLLSKVTILLDDLSLCEQYGRKGFIKLEEEYSAESHYGQLMDVFTNVVKKQVASPNLKSLKST